MARTATVTELNEAMKSHSVTGDWDVVVSYSTKKLNAILDSLWYRGGKTDFVAITPKSQPGQLENDYEMKLHNPTLNFVTKGPATACLKMGLSGTAWIGGKAAAKKVDIQLGTFQIQFEVPVVSVPSDAQMSGSEVPSVKPADSVIEFHNEAGSARNIIFHFQDIRQEKWEVDTLDKNKATNLDASIDMTEVVSELQTWFYDNIKDVDYCIAQVNNEAVPGTESSTVLRPKSFVFATHGEGDDSVLSIYIQTEASNFNPGQTSPTFPIPATDSVTYRPIPDGFDAAVTIRYEVMRDLFFLPSINDAIKMADGSLSASDTRDSSQDGFQFSVKMDVSYIESVQKDYWWGQQYGGKIWGNLKETPLTLRVRDGYATWSLEYWQSNIGWQQNQYFGMPGMSGWIGAVDAHCWVNNTQQILPSNHDLHTAAYSFKPQSEFHLDLAARPDPDPWSEWPWYKKLAMGKPKNEWSNSLPANFQGFKVNFNEVKIEFKNLNFLLTKNIFANALTKDIIQVDTDKGLFTPHDVILVGKVVTPGTTQ
ncbi:hypothetical protein V8C40DRAFT_165624 [Trichoderma camerunense]